MLHQEDWDDNLCMAEFAINNSHHASTKHTPFFLYYGMHTATPVMVETIKASKIVPAAAKWSHDFYSALQEAKKCLQDAKDIMKSYTDAQERCAV